MSRSNSTQLIRPAHKYFEWSGSEGKLKYYDKETKENVFVNIPFTFLVLDQLSTLTGYDKDQGSFWSNEVRSTRVEPFTLRSHNGLSSTGLYQELKVITGVKYAKSIYIAYYEDKELTIGNFKASGSALSSWIEFTKGRDVEKGAIVLAEAKSEKNGATRYFAPVFKVKEDVSEATEAAAVELDRQLQNYLTTYFESREGHQETTEFAKAATANGDFAVEPPDDLPADLDDQIPF